MFVGQGIVPDGYNALADAMPQDHLAQMLDKIETDITAEVSQMRPHADFLRSVMTAPSMGVTIQ